MKKTKVIEFIQSVGDGGAETLVKDYALLMDRERFDVTVVVLHEVEDSANLRRLRENGVPVIALSSKNDLLKKWWRRNVTPIAPELTADKVVGQTQRSKVTGKTQMPASGKKNIFRKGMHYLRNLFFGLKLLKIVKDTGATVLHAHLEVLEIIGAVSGFLKHVRLFHTCHNVPSIIYIEGERPAAAKLIRTNDLQLVALHSDMEAELNELFGIDNTVTIRNGINMPQFADPGIDGMAKRREIGIPGDAFVLGHVGRFSEQKNHGFLVDVFIEVAKRRENAYLLMIGAGETKAVKAKLRENGLQDRYQILSNRKDINELLKTMDVFVFPSLFEGLSVSLVEAQAAGLRCIVSDRCSEEGFCTETCIPLPLGDPAAWADAVLDPDRKRKTDRKLSDYDMNREIRRLEALYMKAKQAPCSKSAVRDDKKGSSRIEHSKRNIISGVFRQMLNIMLAFVSRTAVLYLLGPQYLGLGSLFTSILTVLNLADLGFTVAVIYVLYKPIAENDHSAICAIMAYLKKTYGIIGTVILVLGLAILPFLRLLISADYPADINIYLLYLLFLLNTVVSYRFFAYKNALLTAMQRNDIVNNVYSLTSLSVKAGQIVVLFLFRNYYIFTMVLVLGTVANNLLVQYFSKKYYPEMIPTGTISEDVRQEMNQQVKAIFMCRVGDVMRNSCDSIFISAFLGLTCVAIYDNYFYIFNAVFGVIWLVSDALQASVGNSIAVETVEKNEKDLYLFDFIFTWFIGWCTVCLCCLYQPFINLWMDRDQSMMLSNGNMILICFYFYALAINNIRNLYVNGAGLFVKMKWWYVLEAVANILLNWVLGYFLGITGIIAATLISIIICNFIARTNILFRNYFKKAAADFYRNHIIYFVIATAACAVTWLLCSWKRYSGMLEIAENLLICMVVPNLIFVFLYHRTERFAQCTALVKRVLKRN